MLETHWQLSLKGQGKVLGMEFQNWTWSPVTSQLVNWHISERWNSRIFHYFTPFCNFEIFFSGENGTSKNLKAKWTSQAPKVAGGDSACSVRYWRLAVSPSCRHQAVCSWGLSLVQHDFAEGFDYTLNLQMIQNKEQELISHMAE